MDDRLSDICLIVDVQAITDMDTTGAGSYEKALLLAKPWIACDQPCQTVPVGMAATSGLRGSNRS